VSTFAIWDGSMGLVCGALRIPVLGLGQVQVVPLAPKMVVDWHVWINSSVLGASDIEGG
jgi:hypothetical protein